MKKRLLLSAMLLLVSPLLFTTQGAEPPHIVVFISIDQMRADHLERYSKEYSAGFKRLLSGGMFYTNAELNYAVTSTGPGHATLATGVYPWKSGIVSNRWRDRNTNRSVYCVEDSLALPVDGEGGGMSPKNLMVTAVGDWLQDASPQSKVVSISYKDRAAILMGGKKPTYAFWYDRARGHMATSSYYASALPEWAKEFNASGWIERSTPLAWTKLKPDSVYNAYGPDDFVGEASWNGNAVFPHTFEPSTLRSKIFGSPFGNSLLLDFARAALHGEGLGKRGVTDLLCISLSPTDNIGSSFGPNSHEMIDNLLRLDLLLGSFLAELEAECGRERVLVVLAGDHGVMPLPEYITQFEHRPARRLNNRRGSAEKLQELDMLLRGE